MNAINKILSILLLLIAASCASSDHIAVSDEGPVPGEPVTELYLFSEDRLMDLLYSRSPESDSRINAYARIGESGSIRTLRYGFRFRGNTSRYHPKKSYNIRFEHPQPFLFNSPRMNLNAMYTDPSGMREKLAWDMFYELGRPASKSRYFALYINRHYEGLGIHVQRVDDVLLQQHGLDPSGSMVRDLTRRRGASAGLERESIFGHDLSQYSDKPAFLASMFNSRWAPQWSELVDLVEWVHDTPPGDQFEEVFRQRFDMDVFTDWLAIHILIADVDAFGDDYWMYKGRSSSDKWKIIPWDHDLSFGRNERDGLTENRELGQYGRGLVQLNDYFAYEYPLDDAGWDNKLISSYLQSPGLLTELKDRLEFLMNQQFTLDYFQERTDIHRAKIEHYINIQPSDTSFYYNERQHHGEANRFEYHVETILDFVELRYAYLDRQINPVQGTAYTATKSLPEDGAGSTVLLTDSAGWTIAKFETSSVTGTPEITIETSKTDEDYSINRAWNITVDGGTAEGSLTLYYRNDIAPDGKENWFYTDEAISSQWKLEMIFDGNTVNDNYVNPYSNKVRGTVRLSGEHRVVLN